MQFSSQFKKVLAKTKLKAFPHLNIGFDLVVTGFNIFIFYF